MTFARLSLFILFSAVFIVSMRANVAWAQPASASANSERRVVIGDIHGDLRALLKILMEMKLIDSRSGAWIGGKTQLELSGDLVAKGSQTRGVLDFLMALQKDAEAQGGSVQSVFGNHELMALQGDFINFTPQDKAAFLTYSNEEGVRGLRGAFSGSSRYVRWLGTLSLVRTFQSRDASGKTIRYALVHAGLPWRQPSGGMDALNQVPGALSKMAESGIQNLRKMQIDMVWDRVISTASMDPKDFERLKADYGIDCLIVGHTRTSDGDFRILRAYSDSLIRADTGISASMGGRLSAIEFHDGQNPRDHYFERRYGSDVLKLERMILMAQNFPDIHPELLRENRAVAPHTIEGMQFNQRIHDEFPKEFGDFNFILTSHDDVIVQQMKISGQDVVWISRGALEQMTSKSVLRFVLKHEEYEAGLEPSSRHLEREKEADAYAARALLEAGQSLDETIAFMANRRESMRGVEPAMNLFELGHRIEQLKKMAASPSAKFCMKTVRRRASSGDSAPSH